jgi:hypothetical protein
MLSGKTKSSFLLAQITIPRLRSRTVGHGIVVPHLSGLLWNNLVLLLI